MRRDQSYGIVPLKRVKSHWEVFLVQLHKGHWGFPKGHADSGESPKQTAERELTEETALVISKYLSDETFEEHYFFKDKGVLIDKIVTYFIAEVSGEFLIQAEELADGKWVSLHNAEDTLTFKESKNVITKVISLLS